MDPRFDGIPQHAVRKDSTVVSIPAHGPQPFWMGCELQVRDERVFMYFAEQWVDITDRYNAWVSEQPKTHQVTFEWKDEA